MASANDYLRERFWPDYNRRFAVPAREDGDAFVPLGDVDLDDILCVKEERVVGNDNCVRYDNRSLQIPPEEQFADEDSTKDMWGGSMAWAREKTALAPWPRSYLGFVAVTITSVAGATPRLWCSTGKHPMGLTVCPLGDAGNSRSPSLMDSTLT